MANLLSTDEWNEIRGAIHDVTDTFLKKPITYIQRTERKLYAFNESRADTMNKTPYNLVCLVVPENTDASQAQVMQDQKGSFDGSEGYFLFSYPDLLAFSPSMISGGNPVFKPNVDTFKLDGIEYTIIGVNLVGPTEGDFQLVKVHYKKQLSNSKDA